MRRLIMISFATLFVVFNQACQTSVYQSSNLIAQDVKRISHARELLSHRYKRSTAKQFEGDHRLFSYIEKYIEEENPNLDAEEVAEAILKVSMKHSYDPVFLLAVIKTESRFQPDTIGRHGEIGLMQVKPSTAQWMAEKYNMEWRGASKLKDPAYNIEMGALYFSYLRTKMESKNFKYINAYNMGPTNLNRLPASSQKKHPYVGKVMANYRSIYSELKKYKQSI